MPALAPWASDPRRSRGRRIDEPGLAAEQVYRIDRERIVHCTAFRRLVYKTQVFINHEGDLFRTRLTHSLEVAQLARSLARELRLNEDLVEAIALAHDLGHTPFGHAGQDALHECMRAHGGFEHNLQSLRVVDMLEQCHARFDGLNLGFETREGILKHCSRAHAERLEHDEPGGVGRRFLCGQQPSLEAQLVNLADEMAYNAHDIDDGVRSGLLTAEQLMDVPLYRRFHDEALAEYPALQRGGRRLLFDSIRRMRAAQASDLVRHLAGPAEPARTAGCRCRAPGAAAAGLQRADAPGRHRAEAFPVRVAVPPCPGQAQHRACPAGGGRAVRGLRAATCRDAGRTCRPPAARACRGRLHRRHDRPFCAARAPATHRPGAVCRCG
jgi:dGTPase